MNNIAPIGHNNPPSESVILAQRLANYTEEAKKLAQLTNTALPSVIADEVEAGKVTDYIKSVKALDSRIAEIHKIEKKPFWDAGKAADQWKTEYENKTAALIQRASSPLKAFLDKKAAEERSRQLEIAQKARQEAERLAAEAVAHEAAHIHDTASDLMSAAVQAEQKADMITSSAMHTTAKSRSSCGSTGSVQLKWEAEIESLAAIDLEVLRPYFTQSEIERALKAAVRDGVRKVSGARIYQDTKLNIR